MTRKLGLALLLVLVWAAPALAVQWQWIGPPTGSPHVYVDRNQPRVLYAINGPIGSVKDSQLYRSSSAGDHWTPTGLHSVRQVLVHPVTSRLLVVTGDQYHATVLQESRDNGRTFNRLTQFPRFDPKLAQDPRSDNLLAAFVYPLQQVLISSDGGRSWSDVTASVPLQAGGTYGGCAIKSTDYWDIAFSPAESSAIYISVFIDYDRSSTCDREPRDRMLVSRDLGRSWTVEGSFPDILSFYPDPHFPDRTFATNDISGVPLYVFSTTGLQLLSSKHFELLRGLTTFPGDRNHLLAWLSVFGKADKLEESHDGGITWQVRNNPFPLAEAVFVATTGPPALLAVTDRGGIFKRVQGQQWMAANKGFLASNNVEMSASGNTVFALVAPGFYKTTDGGAHWTDLSFRVPKGFSGSTVAVNPKNPQNVIMGGYFINWRKRPGFFLYVSMDGAETWKQALHLTSVDRLSTTFDPILSSVVYFSASVEIAANGPSAIYKSLNFGMNPVRSLSLPFDVVRIVTDPEDPNLLFFLGPETIYQSTDGGRTATIANTSNGMHADGFTDMAKVGSGKQYIVTDVSSDVLRTVDGGRRWSLVSTLPYQESGGGIPGATWRLYPSYAKDGRLFAISTILEQSIDGSLSWIRIRPQVPGIRDRLEFEDMSDPRILPIYFATDHGVLKLQ